MTLALLATSHRETVPRETEKPVPEFCLLGDDGRRNYICNKQSSGTEPDCSSHSTG